MVMLDYFLATDFDVLKEAHTAVGWTNANLGNATKSVVKAR